MNRQYCPFHADDDVAGDWLGVDAGYAFTCDRSTGHPSPGPFTWFAAPKPPELPGISDLAEELRLHIELPAAIARYPGQWVEYGVVEAAYAQANPLDFARLVQFYGHTAIKGTRYSASSFLAGTLGRLSRRGDVLFHQGTATGRWTYNSQISWWGREAGTRLDLADVVDGPQAHHGLRPRQQRVGVRARHSVGAVSSRTRWDCSRSR